MKNISRNFFIALSNNEFLRDNAKRWGFRLGAGKFVAGTNFESAAQKVRELNELGISTTLDRLGEFVNERAEASKAKEDVLHVLEQIHQKNLNSHVSVKLTQLGLDIDREFCIENMQEIVSKANEYNIFVNIDMEKYVHYQPTLDILQSLHEQYKNVGTVLQVYLYRTQTDLANLKNVRLRIAKGAYRESADVAFQQREKIDANFLEVVKQRLKGGTFTSIATHDHKLIDKIKQFVEENQIDKTTFEFQMLYGFRTELQHALVREGYNFCTYIPFGEDWYGYFMRRLAERPQNINLILKDTFYTEDNKLRKGPLVGGIAGVSAIGFLINRRKKANKR